jgi:hypothetical protein
VGRRPLEKRGWRALPIGDRCELCPCDLRMAAQPETAIGGGMTFSVRPPGKPLNLLRHQLGMLYQWRRSVYLSGAKLERRQRSGRPRKK